MSDIVLHQWIPALSIFTCSWQGWGQIHFFPKTKIPTVLIHHVQIQIPSYFYINQIHCLKRIKYKHMYKFDPNPGSQQCVNVIPQTDGLIGINDEHQWAICIASTEIFVMINEIHKNLWRCPGLVKFIYYVHSRFPFLIRKVCHADNQEIVCKFAGGNLPYTTTDLVIYIEDGTKRSKK